MRHDGVRFFKRSRTTLQTACSGWRASISIGVVVAIVSSVTVLLGAAGCDDPEAHEAAPSIQALDYGPETATVGQQVSVVGTFAFRDPDRDIGHIAFLIVAPDDSVQEVPPQEVPSLRGQRSGTVEFTLNLEPTMAGDHTFEVWVLDDTDFESNHLEGVLQVSEP